MVEPSSGQWVLIKLNRPLQDLGGSFLIRSLGAPGGIAVTIGGLGEEEEANANFMAAAKEMYAALKDFVAITEGSGAVKQAATQALAKAEGRTDGAVQSRSEG